LYTIESSGNLEAFEASEDMIFTLFTFSDGSCEWNSPFSLRNALTCA